MSVLRRTVLTSLLAATALPAPAGSVRQGRTLVFPRDHGAHLDARIEWWYATGWVGEATAPRLGFQVTFFRTRTEVPVLAEGRFVAPQMLFAHAAITDLNQRRHHHAQRLLRWNGQADAAPGAASSTDGRVHIGRWRLWREGSASEAGATWQARIDGEIDLQLTMQRSQPVLLQGDAGFSRKGPDPENASHYYSEPQLITEAQWRTGSQRMQARGRGWLDQEWSDSLMHADAVGWDWIGINLFDGSALTAFRLRRQDGHPAGPSLWGGGSYRAAGGPARALADGEVVFTPERWWQSANSGARYPLQCRVDTPAGRFVVRSLLDAQELDNRASTGLLYWEGLSELLDERGRRVGLGYLELTGYGQRLRL